MKKIDRWGAALIALSYLVLALAHGLVIPPFENLDEIEHFGVVRYIAERGRLPAHGAADSAGYHYRQEASQPPLYHLLAAGLTHLLGLRADDAEAFFRFNPWVACGPRAVSLTDNRAVFYHDPHREAFPWQGTMRMLHVLRVFSTLLQAITVTGTYALARSAFPQRRHVPVLAMAVVAFNPQFLLVVSGINNDNLVAPLATLVLCLLLQSWRNGLTTPRAVGLGVLIGLAGLAKLSGWLLLVLAGLTTVALLLRLPKGRGRLALTAALIPAIALLIAGWWFWRNVQLYGDPTALRPMLALVGERGSPLYLPGEAWLMFRSFWGQIPCSFYPPPFYAFYGALTALALGGLTWGWRRLERQERLAAAGAAGWFLIVALGWLRWDMMTPAPGGRLLFPALPAVALLLALGIDSLPQGRLRTGNWIAIGLLALAALWAAAGILPGFFAPPPRYADTGAVEPDHALEATLGDAARLLGYDIALRERPALRPPDREPTLELTLYWQPLASLDEDYVLALQLVSPVPGDTTLRLNYNSWPGRGNYPTSAWQPGEVIADRYRFDLPEAHFPTQGWDLHLILYQAETRDRLPVCLGQTAIGDRLVLTRLRVPGQSPACPEEARLPAQVRFDEAVALTHAWVTPEPDGARVSLCWESLRPLGADYTVFVHLIDETGTLIGTGDGPPMAGAFPTSLWQPGDVIMDVHPLPSGIDTEEGQYIAVGLYRLDDSSRLPASVGDQPVIDGAVTIWPHRP